MSLCCVCLKEFPGEEEAPILMMDAQGNPLLLCPECASIVDAIAGTPDSPRRDAAILALSEMEVSEPMVADELSRLISREDAPLSEEDGWEDEEAIMEEAPPTVRAVAGKVSSLYFYLGIGCLAAAVILFVILQLVR